MKKSVLFLFMIMLLAVNTFGLTDPRNAMEWLVATNTKLDGLRLIMVATLFTYLVLPEIHSRTVKTLLQSSGIIVMIIVVGSVFFIPQHEHLHVSMYPIDFIMGLESAVLLMMMGLHPGEPELIEISQPEPANTKRNKHHLFSFKHAKAA